MSKHIYLDYAAATPMREEVVEAMKPYWTDKFYNASATYLAARAVRLELDDLRANAAQILGVRPAEIIFTSGATEANNLSIKGVAAKFSGAGIIVSALEHDSVLVPARLVGGQIAPSSSAGTVDQDKLLTMITEKTVLVSVMLVNNELGTLQPLREIAAAIENIRRQRAKKGNKLPLYLHSDATQATNYLDLHVSRLGVDMMSFNGSKMYGPKGSGLLYVKAGTQLAALIDGGGQEFGLRAGTENLAAIAGLVKALELAQAGHKHESRRLNDLRRQFEHDLLALGGDIVINGGKKRAPHLVNVTFAGQDNEALMMKLDEAGVQCALGSACSASSGEPSHVLKAIGLGDAEARSTLRFSLGRQTKAADLKSVVATLAGNLQA